MAFTRDQLIETYGGDYPAAVEFNGVRLPLSREGRFQRYYENKEAKIATVVSRFMDGTAEISLSELKESWSQWPRLEQHDFTSAAAWLKDHPEFPDMMRFLIEEGDQDDVSTVALQVATALPMEEAFQRLSAILHKMPIGRGSNIGQAIALTKHPGAAETLRVRLRKTLADSRLMEPDDFLNWVTYDAICGIEHLLDLGLSASEFEEEVRRISRHPSAGTIDALKGRLFKWYPWLGEPARPKPKC
jgi:hypothetical protein